MWNGGPSYLLSMKNYSDSNAYGISTCVGFKNLSLLFNYNLASVFFIIRSFAFLIAFLPI